ncbi:hypothetical protein B566_EDAN003000 [Ephemera danica]|nr:hypothetical protein B566_EDAN003000 [Ephemera danica]
MLSKARYTTSGKPEEVRSSTLTARKLLNKFSTASPACSASTPLLPSPPIVSYAGETMRSSWWSSPSPWQLPSPPQNPSSSVDTNTKYVLL